MTRSTIFLAGIMNAALLAGCGGGETGTTDAAAVEGTPVAVLTPDQKYNVTTKPGGPVKVDYRIIGTPVVGQPVTVDLQVSSMVGDMPIVLDYQSNDTTAMSFPESQDRRVSLAFVNDEKTASQQVTVVPSREGRLFLNVSASMETDTGTLQTVTAIPIEVGAAPRDLTPSVPATTDEDGNELREMPAN